MVAVAINRAVYQQRGEFAAAIELRPAIPGVTDDAGARTTASWKPFSVAIGEEADAKGAAVTLVPLMQLVCPA